MLRRSSRVSLVIITAIAVVVATVAVVYAVQTIFQTSGISAKVNIVTGGDRILVCSVSDPDCTTLFTGDLDFGNMLPGTNREASFHIKNILTGELAAPVFVGARIRHPLPTGDVVTPLVFFCCDGFPSLGITIPGGFSILLGEVPSLGTFVMRFETGDFPEMVHTGLEPGEVIRAVMTYRSDSTLPPGPLTFDILVDAVDVVD